MEKRVAPLLGMVWAPLGRSKNKRKKKKKKKEKVRKRNEKREQSVTLFLASTPPPRFTCSPSLFPHLLELLP